MKKLFVCAMALAAFVSCSKDDVQGPALDSGSKTVSISIANGSSTRSAVDGGVSGITPAAPGTDGSQFTCESDADDLKIVFANSAGVIQQTLDLTDLDGAIAEGGSHTGEYVPEQGNGTNNEYTWHNVPWAVTQIAVVRVDPVLDADKEFVNISDYSDLAINEDENLKRNLDEIVLFGQADLEDTGATHVVGDIYYHYWNASVTVAPLLARFEINNIECEDLGANNPYDPANPGKYSFDKLTIGEAAWTSVATADNAARTYKLDGVNGKVMHGSYKNTENIANSVKASATDATAVWSWNVDPELTEFGSMTVPLTAFAYDYTPAQTSVPLTVSEIQKNGTKVNFQAGNVYQLNVKFKEEHIMHKDQLCVEVTVLVAKWTVNTVTPVFGNN